MTRRHEYTIWVVNMRGEHDDHIVASLIKDKMYGSSPHEAWTVFIKSAGKDRKHWFKLGYVAQRVYVTIRII